MLLLLTYQPLLDLTCIYSILAFSQYVSLRAGAFSLASPGFALLGAYCGGILLTQSDLGPLASVVAAVLLGTAVGLFLALPLARLKGGFQAIATIGFVEIMVSLTLYAEPLTGGALGLNNIPKVATTPWLVGSVVLVAALMMIIKRTGVGRAFDAVRQDATTAAALGISVPHFLRVNFALSGALGALSGCLLALNTFSISPEEFGFSMLVFAIAAVILGGRSSVAGPIIGTAILVVLPELARPLHDQRLLLQGALLILVIIYLPHGIVDSLGNHWRARRKLTIGAAST